MLTWLTEGENNIIIPYIFKYNINYSHIRMKIEIRNE